jgi:hypothetical protein
LEKTKAKTTLVFFVHGNVFIILGCCVETGGQLIVQVLQIRIYFLHAAADNVFDGLLPDALSGHVFGVVIEIEDAQEQCIQQQQQEIKKLKAEIELLSRR